MSELNGKQHINLHEASKSGYTYSVVLDDTEAFSLIDFSQKLPTGNRNPLSWQDDATSDSYFTSYNGELRTRQLGILRVAGSEQLVFRPEDYESGAGVEVHYLCAKSMNQALVEDFKNSPEDFVRGRINKILTGAEDAKIQSRFFHRLGRRAMRWLSL